MQRLLLATGLVVLLAGCVPTGPREPHAPTSVPEPLEQELGSGWDEKPEPLERAGGPIWVPDPDIPDAKLSTRDLLEHLRVPATAAATSVSCTLEDVEIGVQYYDAAAGSRYGQILVENISGKDCMVKGYPGIGARGEWGSKFLNVTEQVDAITYQEPSAPQLEVHLEPGQSAAANLVWSGELAGALSEPISLFVVQLATNQPAVGIPVSQEAEGGGAQAAINTALDVGMLTTVRVGPFLAEQGMTAGTS